MAASLLYAVSDRERVWISLLEWHSPQNYESDGCRRGDPLSFDRTTRPTLELEPYFLSYTVDIDGLTVQQNIFSGNDMEYIVRFSHQHESFRLAELQALALVENVKLEIALYSADVSPLLYP